MTKDYKHIIKQLDSMETKQEKIRFLVGWLATHNKNLTKTQEWIIDDLLELLK